MLFTNEQGGGANVKGGTVNIRKSFGTRDAQTS